MNVDLAIAKLLLGTPAKDVVEDITKMAAATAASLMKYGMGEHAAIQKSVDLTGVLPDEELLQMATKPHGIGKKGKQAPLQHWIKMGHHNPAVK